MKTWQYRDIFIYLNSPLSNEGNEDWLLSSLDTSGDFPESDQRCGDFGLFCDDLRVIRLIKLNDFFLRS